MRRVPITNWLVFSAVAFVASLAAWDALRSGPSSSTSPATAPIPELDTGTQKQRIARTGNLWARTYAEGRRGCSDMTQPLCERVACERVGGRKIENCRRPTLAFRKSFEGATVEEVLIRNQRRAAARYSNGEVVEFSGEGSTWMVHRIGASARKFFD